MTSDTRATILADLDKEWRSKPAHERLAAAAKLLRDRATAGQTGPLAGTWAAKWDSDDSDYGPRHYWPYAVIFNGPIVEPPAGQEPQDHHRLASTDLPEGAFVYLLTVQPAVGLALADLMGSVAAAHVIAGATIDYQLLAVADAILAGPDPSLHAAWPNAVAAGLAEDPESRWYREEAERKGWTTPVAPQVQPKAHDVADCRCVHTCAEHPPTACSLSGEWHVHPDDGTCTFGACPEHPDAPGDL